MPCLLSNIHTESHAALPYHLYCKFIAADVFLQRINSLLVVLNITLVGVVGAVNNRFRSFSLISSKVCEIYTWNILYYIHIYYMPIIVTTPLFHEFLTTKSLVSISNNFYSYEVLVTHSKKENMVYSNTCLRRNSNLCQSSIGPVTLNIEWLE